ncbi:MAG TPA: trehalose-phosphatase [Beijerinckiaceae bacterium]
MSASQEDCALFLDFDGTLVDIAPTPDAVFVSDALRETLVRLRDRLSGALALISGRQITVLDKHFAPERFDAGGLHGLEVRLRGRMVERPHAQRERLQWVIQRLQKPLVAWPGALIEDKTDSVAVHWRLAPEAGPTIVPLLDEIAVALGSSFRLQRGKSVAEFLPADADKGSAIQLFMQEEPFRGRTPIFFGDDVTDEDGFRIVNALGGYSVNVGQPKSVATFRLADARAVRSRLMRWAEAFPRDVIADLKT